MIKSKYQNQGCKSFIIILLLLSSSKCCLPINEQQAKLITTYFEQTYVLNFTIKKFILKRINGSLVKFLWRFKNQTEMFTTCSNFTKWLNVFIYISRIFYSIKRYCQIAKTLTSNFRYFSAFCDHKWESFGVWKIVDYFVVSN